MISGLFPSIIHYSLPAALFPFSAIHTTILCSFLLWVCSLISTLPLLEKGSWPQTLRDWKPHHVQNQGFGGFLPLLLYTPLYSFIQCNGGKATEYKGIQPVQNSKKKESISTVRLILMPAALLFYHAISPTYTQSFNYRSKESAATNFSFRALLVPCSVQSVRAQLSRKWLIPPSGRVSTWLMLFFFLSLLYFLFPAVIYSGSGMIQLISTVSITQNGENPELSFEQYIRKNKKNY